MTNFIINKEGLSFIGDYYIYSKYIKNNINGIEVYNISIFDKKGINVCYSLKNEGKIKNRLLKDNSFNISNSNIKRYIEDIAILINN